MPRITPVSWKVLDCIFKKYGFVFNKTKGDHRIYIKSGCQRPVVIPTYKEVDIEIIKANMRTASMNRDTYFELLKQCL